MSESILFETSKIKEKQIYRNLKYHRLLPHQTENKTKNINEEKYYNFLSRELNNQNLYL